MPITPLHLGPALALKAPASRYFSFLVFGLTQVVIDSEVALYMAAGGWPVHRLFHTYLGATLVAAVTVVLGRPLLEWAVRLWNRLFAPNRESVLRIEPRIPLVAALSGAFIGGYSHVLLDSVMHSDVRPFAPWSDGNALLRLISADHLALACVGLGILGAAALLAARLRRRRRAGTATD